MNGFQRSLARYQCTKQTLQTHQTLQPVIYVRQGRLYFAFLITLYLIYVAMSMVYLLSGFQTPQLNTLSEQSRCVIYGEGSRL